MTTRVASITQHITFLDRLDAAAYARLARERPEPLRLARGLGPERMRRFWKWSPWLTEAELDERLLRVRQRDPVCRPFNDSYGARDDPVPHDAAQGSDGRWHLIHPDTGGLLCDHTGSRSGGAGGSVRITGDPDWAVRVPKADRCGDTYGMLHRWPGWGRNGILFEEAQASTVRSPKPATVWLHLYARQGLRCAACRRRPPHVIDHDHDTLRVRGLLCTACNSCEADCPHQIDCFAKYREDPPAARFEWTYYAASEIKRRRRDRRPFTAAEIRALRAAYELPAARPGDVLLSALGLRPDRRS